VSEPTIGGSRRPHRIGSATGCPTPTATPKTRRQSSGGPKDGEQFAVACDRYDDVRDNIRTIGLYVEGKRKMSNRPVNTGQDEFATPNPANGAQRLKLLCCPACVEQWLREWRDALNDPLTAS
jgi:hypothetical protein